MMAGLKFVLAILLISVTTTLAIRRVPLDAAKAATFKPQENKGGRLLGGEEAEIGFAPYQASVQGMYGDHMCGASIIHKDWILTAGHCCFGYNPPYLRVIVGTNVWNDPKAVVHFVDEYYAHCNYNFPMYYNDIALMHLNESIKMNEFTQIVPLPTAPMEDGEEVILTGWGSTELWGETPEKLQKVTLNYVTHQTCKEMMGGDENLDVGHICTYTKVGQGSCHGDSGGPLVSKKTGALVGAVNWGYPCATGVPDAHASIYYYTEWIRKTITLCKECQCSSSNYPAVG